MTETTATAGTYDARTKAARRPRAGAFGLEVLPDSETLSVPELVYRQMLDAILSRRLVPATRLREEALAEIFGVSRATVRAALQRLEAEGAVTSRPNRGAAVAKPTPAEVREVLDARRLIECELVRRTAERHGAKGRGVDTEPFAALAALAREEGEHREAGRRGAAARLAGGFHVALARLGGNAPLADALVRLVTRSALGIAAYERPERAFAGWRSRLALLGTVADGDGAGTAAALADYLDTLESSLDLDAGPTADSPLAAAFAHLGENGS